MSSSKKNPKKLDARFRSKPENVWTAARVELAHAVPSGDDFDRPDCLVWLDAAETIAARAVAHDAPDDAIVGLYDEALLHARGAAPTLVRAASPELAAALKDKLPNRPRVVSAPDALRGRELRLPADIAPHGPHDDEERPMLPGAKVDAAALGEVVRELTRLHGVIPWASLAPWCVELVLSAPTRGLPDGSVLVQPDELISVARSVAARDVTVTWPGRQRPRGTFYLDAAFAPAEEVPALADEAAAQGWRAPDSESSVVHLRASDVEDVARPLVRADLELLRLAADAVAAWYAEERAVDLWRPAPLTVDVAPDVTVTLRTTRLATLDADDADDWLERWGPAPTAFEPAASRHEALLATLRDAGDRCPPDIEARVAAAGADAVPALCDALADAVEPDRGGSEWHAPWLLLALGRIGDLRALPYVVAAAVLHREELGDFFTEDLPAVFAGFGPGAVPQLTELVASPCLDAYLRVAAGTALYAIGVDHPEARPRVRHVFTALYDWFDEDSDPPGTVSALLATRAARMGDDALYASVVRAVEDGVTDPMFLGVDDLAAARAEGTWARDGQVDLLPVAEKLRRPDWCA